MMFLHIHLSGSRKVPPVSTTLVAANTERCLAEVGRDFLVHAISLLLQKCTNASTQGTNASTCAYVSMVAS
jgi:hypothetical protein